MPTGRNGGTMIAVDAAAHWAWSDAWVLAAITITGSEGAASLTDVVAAADAVNHAIVLDTELEQAVGRLLGAGLIEVPKRRFRLTDAGRAMAARCSGGMRQQVDHLLAMLRRLPLTPVPWHLEPDELETAVAGWRRRAARHLR